jgi:hypothetical protein
VLSASRIRSGRLPASLRQEYEEFILQRIDEYKDQLSRPQLLEVADEAVRELEIGPAEQLVLTEVLVLEHVDRLIMRRLKLPSYKRWRERHLKLRRAQSEPTHWGLDPDTPLASLVHQIDAEGGALALGARATPAALFLAAHDVPVLLIDQEIAAVEAAENMAIAESVAPRFQALVVHLGTWFPDTTATLVVVDPGAISGLDATTRIRVLDTLQARTTPGGIHCYLPPESRSGTIALTPDALQAHYAGWLLDRTRRTGRTRWFTAGKPADHEP